MSFCNAIYFRHVKIAFFHRKLGLVAKENVERTKKAVTQNKGVRS